VASRVTLVIAGVIMILMGVLTKFGALLGTIPTPLIGALFAFGMAMVAGIALSTLRV
jgi:xanthine/uracil permease